VYSFGFAGGGGEWEKGGKKWEPGNFFLREKEARFLAIKSKTSRNIKDKRRKFSTLRASLADRPAFYDEGSNLVFGWKRQTTCGTQWEGVSAAGQSSVLLP